MISDFKQLLNDLVDEFNLNKIAILKDHRLTHAIKLGYYAIEGSKRNGSSGKQVMGRCFNLNVINRILIENLKNTAAINKIYEYIKQNVNWHTEYNSFENALLIMPSVLDGIAGGFLARNFELNHFQFVVTESSFNIAYEELCVFLNKDYVEYEMYIHLRGVTGEISEVQLTDDVSIVKAGFDVSKFFSISYSGIDLRSEVYYEDDYMLKVVVKTPKEYYNYRKVGKRHQHEKVNVDKWKILPILGISGYLEIGKTIVLSSDWPIVNWRELGPYGDYGFNSRSNKSFTIDQLKMPLLQRTVNALKSVETVTDLHKKIQYSIERLSKSKSAKNIDDRVVELSIAFEYLINTTKSDVLLQLRLKTIKLNYEENFDEGIYKSLSDFYELRSSIIHGNDKIKTTEKNNFLIEFMEEIVQKSTIRLLELTREFKYEDIDKALTKSLHISKSLMELLSESRSISGSNDALQKTNN